MRRTFKNFQTFSNVKCEKNKRERREYFFKQSQNQKEFFGFTLGKLENPHRLGKKKILYFLKVIRIQQCNMEKKSSQLLY